MRGNKYRPWPKRFEGVRKVIDKDRIKELYLEGKVYEWAAFCQSHNFSPVKEYRNTFRFTAWQAEWINKWSQEHDDALVPAAIEVRRQILKARLELPKRWGDQAEAIRSLFAFALRREQLDAQHDNDNEEAIRKGTIKPKSKITPKDIATLAQTALLMNQLDRDALLLPAQEIYDKVIPIKQQDATESDESREDARLAALDIEIPGVVVGSQEDLAILMAKYIDQAAVTNAIEDQSQETLPPADNAPLDPLDES